MRFKVRNRVWLWGPAMVSALVTARPLPICASIVTNVQVGDIFFAPKSVSIHVGDKVRWYWTGTIQHSTTSNTGLWNSGLLGKGATYTNTFNSAGSFPYHCTIHSQQTGLVTVQTAAIPAPTVSIIAPTTGTTLAAPATFELIATANDSASSVTNVQFFQGTSSLGNVALSPYSVTVSNLAAGTYELSAVASDAGGLRATNVISLSVVTPAPITLSSPQRVSVTNFQFNYTANAGLTYLVERSGDLVNWTAINTNVAESRLVLFEDANPSAGVGFYRVGLFPNP